MNEWFRLAVDGSHLYLQVCAGVLDQRVHQRLLDYDRIVDLHVSRNGGKADTHQPLTADTYGLDWARSRLASGTPVVLEPDSALSDEFVKAVPELRPEGRNGRFWDSDDESIPAFAAFCEEGAHQEMLPQEAFSPYAIFRRDGADVSTEIVGVMVRP